jgi:flagellar hook-length control protein FliK
MTATVDHFALNRGVVGELQVSSGPQTALPMSEARFGQQLLDYMTTQLSQLNKGGFHRATIVLDPPYLGNLEVEIRVQGTQIKATFVASTELVKTLLEANMNDLKQSFTEAGFEQGETSVLLRENKSNNSSERDKAHNWASGGSFIPGDEKAEKTPVSGIVIGQEAHYLINLQV